METAQSPERVTHCLCPHLWETSMSQGRELTSKSLRLLAWTRDGERETDRPEEEKKENERRERDRLRSVTMLEEKSDRRGEGVKGGRERLNRRKEKGETPLRGSTVTPAGRFTPSPK